MEHGSSSSGVPDASYLRERTWLERRLSLLTDVHAGEGPTALLLAANVFCLLAFYYVLKTVRESLILSEGGAEIKSYSAAGQALLLFLLVPAYSALAARMDRVRLIVAVTVFFASHLLIFVGLGSAGFRVGVAFFLWLGVFNLVVIAQFWGFANDIYTSDRGKRLLPLVGLGSSLGAWVGTQIAAAMFGVLGPYRLLLLSAAGLVACLSFTSVVDRRERARDPLAARISRQPIGGAGGFQLVLTQRYLRLIALLVLVLNIVNTLGGFILDRLVVAHVEQRIASGDTGGLTESALIGQFYGSYLGWVNLLGFLIQLFAVSRIFKYVGVRGALYCLPIVATFSYALLAAFPILSIVRGVKILENSTDYSVQNTARHALFLKTSREAKYSAKQAIEGFFQRAGDLLQAVIVFVGVQFAFGVRGFALINLALVAVWFLLVAAIGREHMQLPTQEEPEEVAA